MKRLASTNILCVKIFQAVALNNNWISENTNEKLLQYTDNAPWNDKDIDYELLDRLAEHENLLILNNHQPINAGMISVVFKAIKGKEGRVVAIKMKRKNIDQKLDEAISHLKFVLKLLSFIPLLQLYEFPNSIRENIDILKEQTNFTHEVSNMQEIRENCKRLNYLFIPHVYAEVTKRHRNVIMTDFIDGKKITEISDEDRVEYAQMLNKFVFISLFVHGISHGDMHGGNVLFIQDPVSKIKKLGLIDFGVVYRLSSDFRETLFNFCTGFVSMDLIEFSAQTLDSDFFSPKGVMKTLPSKQRDHVFALVSKFIQNIRDNSNNPNQMDLYEFFFDLNLLAKEHKLSQYGIKLSDEFIKLQMYLAMSQGVTMELAGENYMETANAVIQKLFQNTMNQFT